MKSPLTGIQLAITIVSTVYGAALFMLGIRLTGNVGHLVAYAPTGLGLLAVAFDKWIWRWPFVLPFVTKPLVRGMWFVTISPTPNSRIPPGGNRGPIEGAVLIEQNYFSIHVTQYTDESTSQSTVASIGSVGDSTNQSTLSFMYTNASSLKHRARSPVHDGACQLAIAGDAPTELRGGYWTSRLTAGDLHLTLVSRKLEFSTLAQFRDIATLAKPSS
jgi:hypothetical protein